MEIEIKQCKPSNVCILQLYQIWQNENVVLGDWPTICSIVVGSTFSSWLANENMRLRVGHFNAYTLPGLRTRAGI